MMCLLLLLVPDNKTKAATDLLVTFIPVSSLGLMNLDPNDTCMHMIPSPLFLPPSVVTRARGEKYLVSSHAIGHPYTGRQDSSTEIAICRSI